ncbi:hypothetical protein B0H10DRAFT_2194250 [Mycena sp. CBHHK59/15]|nr:hypothetical protein B0H10DRAFT_2194250 [Mycena sp. CBHHK59/15]
MPQSSDPQEYAQATVQEHSIRFRGRATRVCRLSCRSTPASETLMSAAASSAAEVTADGLRATTQATVLRWSVCLTSLQTEGTSSPSTETTKGNSESTGSSKLAGKKASQEHARTMCSARYTQPGTPLFRAKSSSELCMALVHAVLGWLSLYQSGFMHRDINVENVLLTEGVCSKPFDIAEDILTAAWLPASLEVDPIASTLNDTKVQESGESPVRQTAEEIKALLKQLQVSAKYTAFITDSDLVTDWRTYFDNEHNLKTRTGIPEFMSLSLQSAVYKGLFYLRSPVDDIQSFFWLALWAVLFNIHQSKRSRIEVVWQKNLDNAQQKSKSSLPGNVSNTILDECSPISQELLPLLIKWWRYQEDLRDEWTSKVIRSANNDKSSDFYLYHFHLYALRGVRDFLRIVDEHHDHLKQFQPFVD